MKCFKEQMEIAREVLSKLSILSPKVVLAGGAPRDWYRGLPCNDLDIYMNIPDHTTIESTRERLGTVLGIDSVKTFSEINDVSSEDLTDIYSGMSKIKRIWQFEYKGLTVQLMDMDIDHISPLTVIDTFQNSFCEFWFSPDSPTKLNATPAAKIVLDHNIVFITDNYKGKKHHKKMIDRFGNQLTYLDISYKKGIQYALTHKEMF